MSLFRVTAVVMGMICVGALSVALTAAMSGFPTTDKGYAPPRATGVNDVKPPQCTMTLNGFKGSGGNELVLGTAGNDGLNGGPGADCIVGGGGTDTLNGQSGTDVCIGHTGDTFRNCETIVRTY